MMRTRYVAIVIPFWMACGAQRPIDGSDQGVSVVVSKLETTCSDTCNGASQMIPPECVSRAQVVDASSEHVVVRATLMQSAGSVDGKITAQLEPVIDGFKLRFIQPLQEPAVQACAVGLEATLENVPQGHHTLDIYSGGGTDHIAHAYLSIGVDAPKVSLVQPYELTCSDERYDSYDMANHRKTQLSWVHTSRGLKMIVRHFGAYKDGPVAFSFEQLTDKQHKQLGADALDVILGSKWPRPAKIGRVFCSIAYELQDVSPTTKRVRVFSDGKQKLLAETTLSSSPSEI